MHVRLILLAMLLRCFASIVSAQNSKSQVKLAPPPYSNPTSGEAMYKDYCAACHGLTGRGDGPAARAMGVRPTDLSALSEQNGGHYPSTRVQAVLRFGSPGHRYAAAKMPIWGDVFRSNFRNMPDTRSYAINAFIASLQSVGQVRTKQP